MAENANNPDVERNAGDKGNEGGINKQSPGRNPGDDQSAGQRDQQGGQDRGSQGAPERGGQGGFEKGGQGNSKT